MNGFLYFCRMTQTIEVKRQIRIPYILRLVIFWLVIFALFRFTFLAFHFTTIAQSGLLAALHSIIAGFRLDLSTISFLIFPPFLFWILQQFMKGRLITLLNTIYNIIILFLISLLAVSNIKMYHEWGALLNFGVFDYVSHPREVLTFISTSQLLLLIAFLILYFGFSLWLYKKIVTNFSTPIKNIFLKTALILLPIVILPIMARGGLQLAPINESSAYFSTTPFYNHVAINPAWYFLHSYFDLKTTKNPYVYMDSADAEKRNKNLFLKSETPTPSILKTQKPNIVIIILESWTADIIQSLGGENNITPNFDTLSRQGLLFTQIYAAGSRTEHGLISVLSGFPPPPLISIITIPAKSEKLKSINSVLADDGYSSSFYYGGEAGFVNMKSYLINSGFASIVDKASFAENQLNSKWGAHDQYVFEKQLHDLKSAPAPFLSVLLTLSSHEPFEVPMKTPFDDDHSEPGKFRKAAYYSDHCLGEYFRAAKKESWYDNTLFILVADHGHRLPKERDFNMPESKRIPLLFFGNVLQENIRGKTVDKTCNQNDIAATLLSQLNKNYNDFPTSRDILNPDTKDFAYYTNDNVWGWITPDQKFIYTYATKALSNTGNASPTAPLNDSIVLDAKAYIQIHYQHYLSF